MTAAITNCPKCGTAVNMDDAIAAFLPCPCCGTDLQTGKSPPARKAAPAQAAGKMKPASRPANMSRAGQQRATDNDPAITPGGIALLAAALIVFTMVMGVGAVLIVDEVRYSRAQREIEKAAVVMQESLRKMAP